MASGSPFARHWLLDPGVVFLNHGSFGACPRAILDRQRELRDELEREPVEFMNRRWETRIDEARGALARFVGASADDLAFVPNATTGVNTVLRSLALERGDELLTTDQEYNACRNALDFVAGRAGANVVVVPIPFPLRAAGEIAERIAARVTARTRLLLVDHVSSATGLVLPVASIVRTLRERGVETLVDGAHAPGMLPLDLNALGAAYYTANCHKWMCTPKGSAFLHVRSDRQNGMRPLAISHGANSPRTDRSRFRLEFDFNGTDDPTPFLTIPDAISFLGGLVPGGWDEIRSRNHALALRARDLLVETLHIPAPAPAPDDMLGSLAAVPLPDRTEDLDLMPMSLDPITRELFDRYRIEILASVWPRYPKRVLRVSTQLYNDEDQLHRLTDALKDLLALHPVR
jgi:isopenicillin-N epimerase